MMHRAFATLARPAAARAADVPIGRRFLFADRRRAALTVLGVAAALLLVLLMEGIFAGAVNQVTRYIRTSPAQVFVSQEGVRTMHMSVSALSPEVTSRVGSAAGVAWVAPIGFASGSVAGPAGRQLSYLIGYDTGTGRGVPSELLSGRAPGPGEAIVDEQAAKAVGAGVGDMVTVLGARLLVVGMSSGGSSITNTTVFVSQSEFARIHHAVPSYLLVGTEPSADASSVAEGIRQVVPGVTVQTREEFAASEARIVTDMSADLLRLMSTIGLLIALAVLALGLMTATLNRLQEYAVLKALGATTGRLAGAVTVQVLWTVTLAVLVAATLALALSWAVPLLSPAVTISITPAAVLRTTGGALAVGLLAASWPLHRIGALDAATAFRETR